MFRFTIYSIVAYAFWLTFVDVSSFVEETTGNTWFTDFKSQWFEQSELTTPSTQTVRAQLVTSMGQSDCIESENCYLATKPSAE